ncbi:hypothetical protein [Clavibacter sp. VKM Ac-2872]|uniref:hypothetical protein n=1 Tax=Clavibacter sp. VKM Ac-2872 TaxID=2783812 RepID=UPI00188BEB6A|nr:hypothetical protein [Clavibacter sp. VKM Ac-2872]MBF4622894.1 hypothetical protein [Clavibacter sp. VKM Ac-2872]
MDADVPCMDAAASVSALGVGTFGVMAGGSGAVAVGGVAPLSVVGVALTSDAES